jgi:hypothetical protein
MARVEPTIVPTITKEQLRDKAEQLVFKDKMTYAEAICHICEKQMIDPIDMAKLVTGPLKLKLEAEAKSRNIIKTNTATLF